MKRNLLAEIEAGMPTFSKGQKLISHYVLENYEKAAYMTASRLGKIVHVSESTVVRFAIELGYEGYPEFQHALQEIVRTRLTSFQRMEVTNNLIGDGDVLSKVLLGDAEKIKHTLDGIDRAAFEEAVERIVSAREIYILGVRASSSLAGFLAHGLRMIFDNVKFVQTTSGSEMFEQIMSIRPEDVMIAISFPRYSKRIIHAVEFAKHAGTDVIAITDSTASPIAPQADQLLIAKSDMASFVDSLVAPLSIINAIIVAVSRKKQEDLRIRLRQLEEIWDEYDVYDKNQE
ncbi:MAG: MurR/RpiR family transcriptional regulator [Ruminococcaceae bacterium]|nr:MurR/RpiR family transcriptional regulator [Oscillospiraceae bacterium]